MAALFGARPRPLPLVLGLSCALALTHTQGGALLGTARRPLLCDDGGRKVSGGFGTHGASAPTPAAGKQHGPRVVVGGGAFRQVSLGSVLGLVGGLAVGTFSKSLAFLMGAAIFGIHWLESRGIHVVPRAKLQRYFSNINLRSAMEDDVAFKLSFGMTFMLAAFGQF